MQFITNEQKDQQSCWLEFNYGVMCDFRDVCHLPQQLVGQFIARAVNDQILSKTYIDGYRGKVDCEYARYDAS